MSRRISHNQPLKTVELPSFTQLLSEVNQLERISLGHSSPSETFPLWHPGIQMDETLHLGPLVCSGCYLHESNGRYTPSRVLFTPVNLPDSESSNTRPLGISLKALFEGRRCMEFPDAVVLPTQPLGLFSLNLNIGGVSRPALHKIPGSCEHVLVTRLHLAWWIALAVKEEFGSLPDCGISLVSFEWVERRMWRAVLRLGNE
ncbi:hypothetical protein FB45DRAFT_1067464 [Roridomyces roridus]|uniref:Uncharacterized protein n=1 Tax=Roridomyces roridus TaxID=1738132 RepID=A0AAD7B2W0_9AGAR|nr:hypothetical protein FB45DRAFT_1067464 [Roridomyces roridus]